MAFLTFLTSFGSLKLSVREQSAFDLCRRSVKPSCRYTITFLPLFTKKSYKTEVL